MSGWTFNSVTIAVGLYPLLGHLTFHICHVKYLSHRVVGTTWRKGSNSLQSQGTRLWEWQEAKEKLLSLRGQRTAWSDLFLCLRVSGPHSSHLPPFAIKNFWEGLSQILNMSKHSIHDILGPDWFFPNVDPMAECLHLLWLQPLFLASVQKRDHANARDWMMIKDFQVATQI
jgi:hypothetical protein